MRLPAPKRMTHAKHPKVLGQSGYQSWDFTYNDQLSFEDILNDFFNHHDFGMLESAKNIYEKDPVEDVQLLVDLLVSSNLSIRLNAAIKLLHYSFHGSLDQIKEHNVHLGSIGAFKNIYKALVVMVHHFDTFAHLKNATHFVLDAVVLEVTIYLSLLFTITLANTDNQEFLDSICQGQFLPLYLCQVLEKLAEGNRQHFPIKKLLMLLWILTRSFIGSDGDSMELKVESRSRMGLSTPNNTCKVSPQEFSAHEMLMLYRYPSYCTPNWKKAHSVKLDDCQKKQFERYYETVGSDASLQAQLDASRHSIIIPPISVDSPNRLPVPLQEAYDLHEKYLYVPSSGKKDAAFEGTRTEGLSKKAKRMGLFIEYLHEEFPNHLAMLVRLLFYLNISPTAQPETSNDPLDEVDAKRHKEIVTNTISSLILLYLKDSLMFEHLCCILAESNGPILILKMLSSWFSNTASKKRFVQEEGIDEDDLCGVAWLEARPELPELWYFVLTSVMNYYNKTEQKEVPITDQKRASTRNFTTTINLLRILQKIVKNKPARIMAMVQWKSFAVFKRILRIQNEDLHLYSLKLLKCQIPYLGKKWRMNNTHIISLLYLHVRSRLKEETLAYDLDVDGIESMNTNNDLKQQIQDYLKNFKKLSKKEQTDQKEEDHFDSYFESNYEDWLTNEVLQDSAFESAKSLWDPLQFTEPLANDISVSNIDIGDEDVSTYMNDSGSDIDEFTEGWTDGMVLV